MRTGSPGSSSTIDLNQDGVTDFILKDTYIATGGDTQDASFFLELPSAADAVAVDAADEGLALNQSAEIGPKLRFENEGVYYRLAKAAVTYSGVPYQDGSFLNQTRKFLGLKLVVNGEAHYGWARVSTALEDNKIYYRLLDYAYQSAPNKPIYAGQGIPSSDANPSLGSLAHGSALAK